MTETKFVTLYDIHIGNELTKTADGWKQLPAHDEKLIGRVMNFIKDFQPDVIILGGDQLNLDDISEYNKAYKIDKAPGTILQAVRDFRRLILDPLERVVENSDIWWMDGNHEARLDKFVAQFPAMEGLATNDLILGCDKYFSRGEIASLGKLHWVHGDTVLGSGGQHPATALMSKYHCNIRCGHFHTFDIAVETSLADVKEIKTAMVIPCMRNRRPAFMHNSPNKHIQGFSYGFVTKKGNFNDYVVIDTGGFTVDGRYYG